MLARLLKSANINSDVLQLAGVGSIVASIVAWRAAARSGDKAHAERFGIFVGLWAPTFFALAEAVDKVDA